MAAETFRQFYAENKTRLTAFARIAAGNNGLPPHYTDDVLQEGMIRTWQGWNTKLVLINENEPRLAWAYVCLQNVARNMYRHEIVRRSNNHKSQDVSEYEGRLLTIGLDRTCFARETLGIVVKAIQELPERQRLVLLLSKFGDISQKVIGETLDISQGTVSRTLDKAYTTLRKLVGEDALRELELDDTGGGVA